MHGSAPTDGSPPLETTTVHIPDVIPVFPLSEVVLLPGEVLPLHIFEPRYRAMVHDVLSGSRVIGMVQIDPAGPLTNSPVPPIRDLGCAGFIAEHRNLPEGRFLLRLLGLERFFIDEELTVDTPYRQARVTYDPVAEDATGLSGLQPLRSELHRVLPRLVDLDDEDRQLLAGQMSAITDSQLIALASQILELPSSRKRELLEADNQADRFMLVYEDLYRHLDENPDLDDEPPSKLN
jgi:Lon protease-like protein